jgi:hypothetical protein
MISTPYPRTPSSRTHCGAVALDAAASAGVLSDCDHRRGFGAGAGPGWEMPVPLRASPPRCPAEQWNPGGEALRPPASTLSRRG